MSFARGPETADWQGLTQSHTRAACCIAGEDGNSSRWAARAQKAAPEELVQQQQSPQAVGWAKQGGPRTVQKWPRSQETLCLLGHVAALLCIFVCFPAFCAWTELQWNTGQHMRCIILRTMDVLRVACICICYPAMAMRSKLPNSMVHPPLTPQPRQGQSGKYVPVKPPTSSTWSAKNKIPFYILHQKHFSSCPALLLLLLFVVDPLLTAHAS